MAPSGKRPVASTEGESQRAANAAAYVGDMPTQTETYVTAEDLQYIQDVILAANPERPKEESQRAHQAAGTPGKRAARDADKLGLSSCHRIANTSDFLAVQGAPRIEADEARALVKQREREALVKRAESLLRANTEQHQALKAGLMRSDWLGALKEQEKWNRHLKDLDEEREEHHRRVWKDEQTKAARQEEGERERLQEKIRDLKLCRLQQLEANKAKREKEKAVLEDEARKLKERVEKENHKFAEEEQQKRARYTQMQREAMEWASKAAKEKLEEFKKQYDEEKAEAASFDERAPRQNLLEARIRELRQRRCQMHSDSCATRPPVCEVMQKGSPQKDDEQDELSWATGEALRAQKAAEQHRAIAEERLRQHKAKIDAQSKIAREDAAFAQQWREEHARALTVENERKEERRQQTKRLAVTLQQQIAAAQERRQKERNDEKEAFRAALSTVEKSEEVVGLLGLRCVQNALSNGNSHWPIVRAMRKYPAFSGLLHDRDNQEAPSSDDSASSEESSDEK